MVLMTYNNTDLSELITIQEVLRNVGNERVITTDDSPKLGLNITQVKTSAKTITVSFYMKNKFNKYALNQDKHTLAGIFNVDEPVKITFDDEPDKYYLGFVNGLPDIEDPIAWLSVLSIELLIPDGVAHSTTYKEYTDYTFETVDIDIDNGENLLNNSSGTFKPNKQSIDEENGAYDNFEYYYTTNITMKRDKTYAVKAETDGEFSGLHNGSVESDRVVLFLARYENGALTGTHRIISDENTADGTYFVWNLPDGNYVLRVNTYHRSAGLEKYAKNVKIVEAEGKMTVMKMNILNEGNTSARPIITINSNDENGYYGIVNSESLSAVGDAEETDGKIIEYSKQLFAYRQNYWQGINLLSNSLDEFKPDSNPTENFKNEEEYPDSKITLTNGKRYILKAKTDGVFTNTINPNIESDNIVLSLVNDTEERIISDGVTSSQTWFTWDKPSGEYWLKVTTFHKNGTIGASEVDISVYFEDNVNFLQYALADAKLNEAIINDSASKLTWTSTSNIEVWGRHHLSHNPLPTLATDFAVSSLTYEVEPTEYDYTWWRQIFWAGTQQQQGIIKVLFSDDDDNFLYGLETDKRSNSDNCNYNLIVADNKGGYRLAKNFTFKSTDRESDNPFNKNSGWSDVVREGSKIKMYWRGSRYDIDVPELSEKRTKKIHFVWQSIYHKAFLTHAYFDAFVYTNNRGTLIQDVPNRYKAGTELVLNSENKTIQKDGIYDISQKLVGSDFITIPKGESQLEFYTSSWSDDLPDISVKFEERYL